MGVEDTTAPDGGERSARIRTRVEILTLYFKIRTHWYYNHNGLPWVWVYG